MKKHYADLILEVMRQKGTVITVEEIYYYVLNHKQQLDTKTTDYQRSVRGVIRNLKKKAIIESVGTAKYRLK